ncbi:MAG TPA: serine/threonine protein phosphatase [Bacteroidetes bacterium]|nr:serine/threonine protein phosphatase [Bacteroidota bacterium]
MNGRLLAIGDSHGCSDRLNVLINDHVRLTKKDKLILLGDYIDRGPDSKGVLDLIMKLASEGYEVVTLMGNHENMMINAPRSPLDNYNWMMNGGDETLRSFGVSSVNEIDRKYMDFLLSMPFYHKTGNFIFVHGGFNDDIEDPFRDTYSMIWERRYEYHSPVFKGKIIVHGHRPHPLSELKEQIKKSPSVINIDTGCVYGKEYGLGDLTAIDLLKMELYSISCEI